ncbi:hypothetical protein [Natrinema sp. SYSU A 869]|uniref:hypothetical protein n=1 Tax=Natrinema sp. SYSU A 869 TaxID=2871694 RepID=UPI001CA3B166|nr:hypothetical protein [Natrinema sp. SYSU A 869]
MVQDGGDVILYTYHFEANESFDVVSELEADTTVRALVTADLETVPEISQPDEYNGYIIRYQVDDGPRGPTVFLFTRDETLETGDSATLGEEAQMFSSQLNLIETTLD